MRKLNYLKRYYQLLTAFSLLFFVLNITVLTGCKPAQNNYASQLNENGISLNSDNIQIKAEVATEIYPSIAKEVSEGNKDFRFPPVVSWNVTNNNSESVQLTLTSQIQNWTNAVIKTIQLAPNESKEILQTPFGMKLLNNLTLNPATVFIHASIGNKEIFRQTKSVNIRAVDDMILSSNISWDGESLVAAWVTPNDPVVESILTKAKGKIFHKNLDGYQAADIIPEVKAIFNAVRKSGISYVSSTVSFGKVGFAERVRLPRESIEEKSANCIDGAVLFASLFENIGLEPLIILIPGHAFVGVRTRPGSNQILYIETTMVGRSPIESVLTLSTTFNAAVNKGKEEYDSIMQTNPLSVRIVDIKKDRKLGIYPLI